MTTLKMTRGKYRMVLIAMCGLMASSLGVVVNTAGIFFGPIAADLGFGERITSVSLGLTINNLVFAFSGMLVARLVRPRTFRPVVIAATALLAATTALLSACRGLASFYALSALRGFAAGLVSNVLVTTVIGDWFHSDTGLISSLTLGCSGIAGALFTPVMEQIVRGAGWRTAYLASAGLIVLLNLPAMALPIALRPEDAGLAPLRADAPAAGGKPSAAPRRSADARSPWVLLLAAGIVSAVSFVSAMPQLFKAIAATYGLEQTGVAMMSVVLVVNTGGKLLMGAMTDRLGVRRSLLICDAVIAAGILLLMLVRVPAAMLLSAALIGLCYSVPTVGATMICRELFSPERYARVFPKINLGVSVANALGYPLLSAIHGATGGYTGALLLSLALVLATMAAVICVYRMANGKVLSEK